MGSMPLQNAANLRPPVYLSATAARRRGDRIRPALLRLLTAAFGTKRTSRDGLLIVRFRRGFQRVDPTLYPERERWSVRGWVDDIFEGLRNQRKQSFGISCSGEQRRN